MAPPNVRPQIKGFLKKPRVEGGEPVDIDLTVDAAEGVSLGEAAVRRALLRRRCNPRQLSVQVRFHLASCASGRPSRRSSSSCSSCR